MRPGEETRRTEISFTGSKARAPNTQEGLKRSPAGSWIAGPSHPVLMRGRTRDLRRAGNNCLAAPHYRWIVTATDRVGMVEARGFEPTVPTCRIVVTSEITDALRRRRRSSPQGYLGQRRS
jgi:hypothetical protein